MAKTTGIGTADATLVAAGYRLGQSYVPADYTKIFELQYDGIIAAHKARAEAKMEVAANLAENIGDFVDFKAEQKKEAGIDESTDWINEERQKMENISDEHSTSSAKANSDDHADTSTSLGPNHFTAAENRVIEARNEWLKLHNILIPTKEQKARKKELENQLKQSRDDFNKSKANISSSVQIIGSNDHNPTLSWNVDGHDSIDLKGLHTVITNKKGTVEEWERLGVSTFWKDGQKWYKYPKGMYGKIRQSGSDGGGDTQFSATDEFLEIKENDLLKSIIPKEKKAVKDINGFMTSVLGNYDKYVENKKTGGKRLASEFSDFEVELKDNVTETAWNVNNFADLTTRDVKYGNQKRNYMNDLAADVEISVETMIAMGYKLDDLKKKFTGGELDDNLLTNEELNKFSQIKGEIINTLTNPLTNAHKQIAIPKYADYVSNLTEQGWDAKRLELAGAQSKKTITTTTPTTEIFLGKKVHIPKTTEEKREKARADVIAWPQEGETVEVDKARYIFDEKTEMWTETERYDPHRGGWKTYTKPPSFTKAQLLSRNSSLYGRVSPNYFTTGVNTIISKSTKGRNLRFKDYEKRKDDKWYLKGSGKPTLHQKKLNDLDKKIYKKS